MSLVSLPASREMTSTSLTTWKEVLQRQPDHVRGFLRQTSILDRLSGPLCDAVNGEHGGKAMLEALERGNLFVVPLDDRRQWLENKALLYGHHRRGIVRLLEGEPSGTLKRIGP
jgi:LuxR family maltose regulon positive regulatory protein